MNLYYIKKIDAISLFDKPIGTREGESFECRQREEQVQGKYLF